ncbi:MAG: FAD-dependent oxidoreductase [Verrucomicrobiales bacterium]
MNTVTRLLLFPTVLAAFVVASIVRADSPVHEADVVVYGDTPAAIVAAIQVKGMGKSVILVAPKKQLGAMASGGLGKTDKGKEGTIGGMSREFFERVGKHYGKDIGWDFEPKVATAVYEEMLADAGLDDTAVRRGRRLDLTDGVTKNGSRIQEIRCESGERFRARVFLDCTYEGDLMALAGVAYHVGREPRSQYGEKLAGVLEPGSEDYRQPKQFFEEGVDPHIEPGDPSSGLLPGIQGEGLAEPGTGDAKVQAYNFRLCLTTDPGNRIPFTKPNNYDPARYELLARHIQARVKGGLPVTLSERVAEGSTLLKVDRMPNNKTDINDGSPASLDYIGANWDYPEGNYAVRERIWREHVDYTKGLIWFIGNDPRVPADVRSEMMAYGWPRDEYVDTDHFSHQLYVREARRMVGRYVMRQQDCEETRTKDDSIGMGSYGVDSHHIQRVVVDGRIVNEGNFLARPTAYEIPYASLVPKSDECTNLLVPVCLSASHVAFGSLRMEPVWMILGQTAATAAAQAIDADETVQKIDYGTLRERLLADGQRLKLSEWDPASAGR